MAEKLFKAEVDVRDPSLDGFWDLNLWDLPEDERSLELAPARFDLCTSCEKSSDYDNTRLEQHTS